MTAVYAHFTEPEMRGKALHWLLTLEWGGRVVRMSDAAVQVTTVAGEQYDYQPGLDPSMVVEREVPELSSEPAPSSVSFSIHLPDIDIAQEIIQRGRDITGTTGELALWVEGLVWERRLVLVDGTIADAPSFGRAGAPLRFSLEESPFDDTASTHAPDEVISLTTWPNRADNAEGAVYPIVFGQPGLYTDSAGTTRRTSGSPAYMVDTTGAAEKLLIAGHETEAAHNAALVRIYNTDDDSTETFTAEHAVDALGRTVTVVDLTGALSLTIDSGAEYWVHWQAGGGLPEPDSPTTLMEDAGGILGHFAQLSSLRIDRGALAAARPALRGYTLAGFLDEPASPWEVIVDRLLPVLPAYMIARSGRLHLLAASLSVAPSLAPMDLEQGRNVFRLEEPGDTGVEYETIDIANCITLSYALSAFQDKPRRKRTVCVDPDDSDADQLVTRAVIESDLLHGEVVETLSTDVVYQDRTADLILTDTARRRLTHPLAISYRGLAQDLAWLREGDEVLLTDSDLYVTSLRCVIQRIAYSLALVEMRLLPVAPPGRQMTP